MAKELVQLPASVVNMQTKKDKSWKLVFETRELTGEELSVLSDNFQGEGWLVFSPNEINATDVPTTDVDTGQKSQAQRLRAIIYVLWQQKGGIGDPDAHYRITMERLIEYVKEKLEPEEA